MAENEHNLIIDVPVDVEMIQRLIPHRYPFLMVDRLTEMGEDTAIGFKNLTANEPFFQGHFPQRKYMPGVLMVEGLAQCACAFYIAKRGIKDNQLIMFAGIDKVRFRRPVVPGDRLDYSIKVTAEKGAFLKFDGKASVEGDLACSGSMTAVIVDQPE
jgi:3-hydroxyacyl-[acyl-carrier-protein] dehydratase